MTGISTIMQNNCEVIVLHFLYYLLNENRRVLRAVLIRQESTYCVTGAQKGEFMRTGLTKQEKTTDIWFDEKDPLIHIRTHNTDLKKRLLAYSRRYPAICQQMDADPETGCMEFDIAKGRFSFRLTAPYSEERREAAQPLTG